MSILIDAFIEEFLTNFPEILSLGELHHGDLRVSVVKFPRSAACAGRSGAISYPVE